MLPLCKRGFELDKKTKKCYVKCKKGLKRNPETNRCKSNKQKQQVIKRRKPVDLNMSFAPGRFNSFCSISPSQIRKFARKFKISDKIINEYIGKNKSKTESICEAIHVLFPEFVHKLTKVLGEGAFGYVFGTEGERGEKHALKVIRSGGSSDPVKEINMGLKFANMGIAPKIIAHRKEFVQEKSGRDPELTLYFIEMTRIDGHVEEYLQRKLTKNQIENIVFKIFDIIEKLRSNGYVHGDLHLENIAYIESTGQLQVIDYGWSCLLYTSPSPRD